MLQKVHVLPLVCILMMDLSALVVMIYLSGPRIRSSHIKRLFEIKEQNFDRRLEATVEVDLGGMKNVSVQ